MHGAGAAGVKRDRGYYFSDPAKFVVCTICNVFGIPGKKGDPARHIPAQAARCSICDRTDALRTVEMPYAMYLFLKEIEQVNIRVALLQVE